MRYTVEDRHTDNPDMYAGYDIWDNQEERRVSIVPDGHGKFSPMFQVAQDTKNALNLLHTVRELARLQNTSPAHDVEKQQQHVQDLIRAGKNVAAEIAWLFNQEEIDALAEAVKSLELAEEI